MHTSWQKLVLILSMFVLSPFILPLAYADDEMIVRVGVLHQLNEDHDSDTDVVENILKEILEDIAGNESWRLEYIPGSQETLFNLMLWGEIDLVLGMPYTNELADSIEFSQETVISTWGQIYISPGLEIRSLLDLRDKTIAVLDDDGYFDEFRNTARRFNIDCNFIIANSYSEVLEAVDRRYVDAGVVERTYGILHDQDYHVRPTNIVFSPREVRYAGNPYTNNGLVATIDYYLALYKNDQSSVYFRTIEKYFGPIEPFRWPKWLKFLLLVIVIILFTLSMTTVILRLKIHRQLEEISRKNKELSHEIRVRKGTEAKLLRFGTVVEQMVEGVFITDEKGYIQYVNPALIILMRMTEDDLLGRKYTLILEDVESNTILNELNNVIHDGKTWKNKFTWKVAPKDILEIEASVAPIRNQDGHVENFLFVFRNVTHEILLERQLRQSQKMEAIGTLAGGIAHDFNNTLFSMMGYTEIAMHILDKEHEVHDHLKQVISAGQRAKGLIQQILTFSRKSEQEKRILEIEPILKETMKLIEPTMPDHINVKTEFNARGIKINTDPTQMHQVLTNLCSNAAHAMRKCDDGLLFISLGTIELDRFAARRLQLNPGNYAKLTIRDNGHGIERDVLERIFEPFFTTKKQSEGTGMGLSVIHGIVESHNGAIDCYSEVGRGTTFHVFLPIAQGNVQSLANLELENPRGSENVLIVDDEESIAEVISLMLDHLGYKSTAVTESRKALEIVKENPNEFDLLITDLSMPGLLGTELAREIIKVRNNLPVIMITGYGEELTSHSLENTGIREMMMKPVLTHNLAVAVRRVLDQDRKIETMVTA